MPPRRGEWAVVERGGEAAALPARRRGRRPARRPLGGRGRAGGAGGDGRGRAPAQRDLPRSAGPGLVGADARRTPATSSSRSQLGFEAVDWGGVSHAGGGSHGALHAGDSLGPLLFVGCGPDVGGEREQWTLRDVAPVVLEHFGLEGSGQRGSPRSPARSSLPAPRRRRSRLAGGAGEGRRAEAIAAADRDPKVVEERERTGR